MITATRKGHISFFIPLAENLRMGDMWSVSFEKASTSQEKSNDESAISRKITFHQIDSDPDHSPMSVAVEASQRNIIGPLRRVPSIPMRTTVVQFDTTFDDDIRSIDDCLDIAIRDISHFQQAYHFLTGEVGSLLTKKSLPLFVPIMTEVDGATKLTMLAQTDSQKYWSQLGTMLPNKEPIDLSLWEAIKRHLLIMDAGLLVEFIDVHREAMTAYKSGNNITASILIGASAEIFLKELMKVLLWESKMAPSKAKGILSDLTTTKFSNTFQEQLSVLFGFSWLEKDNGIVKEWRTKVADLRNKSVHHGYRPTDSEIEMSAKAFDGLFNEIADNLHKRKLSFPSASSIWLNSFNENDGIEIDPFELSRKIKKWENESLRSGRTHRGSTSSSILHLIVNDDCSLNFYIVDEAKQLTAKIPLPKGWRVINEYPELPRNFPRHIMVPKGVAKLGKIKSRSLTWTPCHEIFDAADIFEQEEMFFNIGVLAGEGLPLFSQDVKWSWVSPSLLERMVSSYKTFNNGD